MQMFNIIFRTIFFYFFIVLAYRIMGKREIAQLGIVDLIISILIGEMVAISIENINDSIFYTVIPIVLLVIIELILAFISIKSRKFRTTFDGKPSILICNGKLNYKELVKQRYTMDDLLFSLRQQSIKCIDEVEYAFLEPNGNLSIFKYNFLKTKSSYPMPLILDGVIQKSTLQHLDKDQNWLNKKLYSKNLKAKDIFYAFYKKNKIFIIKKCEL